MAKRPLTDPLPTSVVRRFLEASGYGLEHAEHIRTVGDLVDLQQKEGVAEGRRYLLSGGTDQNADAWMLHGVAKDAIFERNPVLSRYDGPLRNVGRFASESQISGPNQQKYWLADESFDLPCVRLEEGDGEIYTDADLPESLQSLGEAFVIDDGAIRYPIHPLVLPRYKKIVGDVELTEEPIKRCKADASIRTCRVPHATSSAPIHLKMNMPLYHHGVHRNITIGEAKHAVAVTKSLVNAFERDDELAQVAAFYPEPVALFNRRFRKVPLDSVSYGRSWGVLCKSNKKGSAHLIRSATPYPAHPTSTTVGIDLYAFGETPSRPVENYVSIRARPNIPAEKRPPAQRTLMNTIMENLPEGTNPVDEYIEKIEGPLIEAYWRLALTHGLLHTGYHMQNVKLEVDVAGRPTGRVIIADLSEVEALGDIRKKRGLPTVGAGRHENLGTKRVGMDTRGLESMREAFLDWLQEGRTLEEYEVAKAEVGAASVARQVALFAELGVPRDAYVDYADQQDDFPRFTILLAG